MLVQPTSVDNNDGAAAAAAGDATGGGGGGGSGSEVTVAAAVIDLMCRGVEAVEDSGELKVLKGLLTTVSDGSPPQRQDLVYQTHPNRS